MTDELDHNVPPDVKGILAAFMSHKFLVQSKTDKAMWYCVDIQAHTCECAYYLKTKRVCEHQTRSLKYRESQGGKTLNRKCRQCEKERKGKGYKTHRGDNQTGCPNCGSTKTVYDGDRERCADCGK